MMPGEDGLSLCRWLVGRGGPSVVLLTALADETDRIVGLEPGADDDIVKLFNPRELLARAAGRGAGADWPAAVWGLGA